MAKLVFLQRDTYECLGSMIISAVIKKHGHECDLFIQREERDFIKAVKESSPDIVGFSFMTGYHHWVLETAKRIKEELGVPIILGGTHPTFFPEIIEKSEIDIICLGEGEYATLELMDALDTKEDYTKIKNLHVKKNGKIFKNELCPLIEDLDQLPFPDRELFYKYHSLRNTRSKDFLTGRGCPYSCSFCFNQVYRRMYQGKGKYTRTLSAERVIEEIKTIKERYFLETVTLGADTFIRDPEWLFPFLDKYRKEIGLPFNCSARADLVTEEMARKLKDAGCYAVCFGLESANEYLRNKLLKKRISNEQIIKAANLFKRYSILFSTFNMLGIPGERVEDAIETAKFNVRIGSKAAWSAVLQLYPGTEIFKYAKEKGIVDESLSLGNFNYLFHERNVLNQKNINELVNLQKFFYLITNWPWTIPIVRRLIKLPPNRLFLLFHLLSSALVLIKSHWRHNKFYVLRIILQGLKNIRIYQKRERQC